MSGRRERFMQHLAFGRDPLDDPLNAGWDAIVRPEQVVSPDIDPSDTALLRRLHASEAVSLPSPSFFGDLEQRLAGLYPPPVANPDRTSTTNRSSTGMVQKSPARFRTTPRTSRWFSIQGALAVLAVMMVASLLVLYQAVPGPAEPPAIPAAVIAKPEIEPIAQFEFVPPMWGMPDATAWNHMEIGMFRVAPATSFTTDLLFYTSGDGPFSLTVLSGELTVTPVGSALVYPANQSSQPPVEVSAGESVSIGPNDTLVFSAVETVSGSNSGSEPALALYGLVGALEHQSGSSIQPNDVSFIAYEYANPMTSVPTEGATITLQRLELAPFDTFVFEPAAGLRYLPYIDPAQMDGLSIADGAVDGLSPNVDARPVYGSAQLRYLNPGGTSPGPHTILNLGDKTVDLYFLVVEPFPDAGTPTP